MNSVHVKIKETAKNVPNKALWWANSTARNPYRPLCEWTGLKYRLRYKLASY